MVQIKEPRQEQNIYSPYYYPNFSRYNYPSKIGGDEEQYTEPKFNFPYWDDEIQPYTPPLRRRASTPLFKTEDMEDYFNNKSLSSNNNSPLASALSDDEDDESESETICEKIQNDIDLARKDQKTDYDQFKKTYATFHDDIRALQREIEAIEAVCMKNGLDLKRGCATGTTITDDGTEIYYEPTCGSNNNNNNLNNNNIKSGSRLLASMPSATAAARGGMIAKKRSSPSILYKNRQRQEQQGTFNNDNNNNNNNNRRCLGIEDGWLQERVHQNEGIRC
ncbi:hypothetical protein C1645_812519 [Glomus cerebriforme]|uniref:Uncharacterized protein n=1 Tax=Glomus cerebriforme TaxID=658196 RepID=A0A397TU35_9GLOM|nr:hypothetical protein C1645_812519 [Glomus cerebriforme]